MTNFSEVKIEVEHNDKTYYGQFAKIDRADFGMYDNYAKSPFGTLQVGLSGDGWGVGSITDNILYHDKSVEEGNLEDLGRSIEFIVKVLRVVDAPSINSMVGKSVLSLWTSSHAAGSRCVGIAKPYSGLLSEENILVWSEFFDTED